MITAYYHLHLTERPSIWTTIFIEQMKAIEDHGLMNQLHRIKINCIANRQEDLQMLVALCRSYKIQIEISATANPHGNDEQLMYHRNSPNVCSEDITLHKIWKDCQEEDQTVLYFHSKGTTSFYKHLSPQDIVKHKQYYYWRSLMNYGVLTKWAQCLHAIEDLDYDIAGCNYLIKPSPHYCGNFWWSKSSHIRKLPDPSLKDWWHKMQHNVPELQPLVPRMADEMWIGSLQGTNAYDIMKLPDIETFSACLTEQDYKRYLK